MSCRIILVKGGILMVNSYEINGNTLAIIPIAKNKCRVFEVDNEIIVNKNAKDIIDDSCKYFGSSYSGRFEGTKKILGVSYKSPIIIEESREIIFFPTNSPRNSNCSWISLNNIEDYLKHDEKTLVNFKNGNTIDLEVSLGSFENQMIRSIRLANILKRRKLS